MKQQIETNDWYDNLLWNDKHCFIGSIEHPKHGMYYLWFDKGLYGISKTNKKPNCAYQTLGTLLNSKGL